MPKIEISIDKCKGCGRCIEACPKKCISLATTFNKAGYTGVVFNEEKGCTGCAFCYITCPDTCIDVYK